MELAGRVALVTGAGRRLGRAIADALAGRGMTVALHYNPSKEAETRSRESQSRGGRADCFPADLRDAEAARALPGRVGAEFGHLDVLVNSAAIMHHVAVDETTPELYDQVLALNLRSVFFVHRARCRSSGSSRGKIVNLADVGGLEPWPGYAAHSISKAGVVMLTRVLARSLAPEVTVNAIAPGAVLVPEDYSGAERMRLAESTPLRRLGQPGDIVQAMLYLLERADFVTGDVLVVDGGRVLR